MNAPLGSGMKRPAMPEATDGERRVPPAVVIDGLTVQYGERVAIANASLRLAPGELLAIVGPSGCGKSSLLASVNRMTDLIDDCVVSGTILIDGADIHAPGTNVTQLRRRVGMVFQQPNPFPLSIDENIRFPLREHGLRDRAILDARIEQALRDVGLWSEVKDRLHTTALALSGGQQQRLCIARALVLTPSVLLLDEPCSALDPVASQTVERLIQGLKGRYTILMVTHNLAQARRLADTVAVCWMADGCGYVVETGTREVIFTRPENPLTIAYCNGVSG